LPLSVYVHLPFCDTVCYYCGCNKVATRDHGKSAKYIKYLERELALVAPLLGSERELWLPPSPEREVTAAGIDDAVQSFLAVVAGPKQRYSEFEWAVRAREMGMRTLREDGIRKAQAGLTTCDEVIRATVGDVE